MIRIGIVQSEPRILDVDGNLFRLESHIQQVASEGAQIIVLPETFNTGFTTQEKLMTVAEVLDGRSVSWMQEQAAQHNAVLTGSIYECYQGHFYNTMVLITPDGGIQHYRKRNPTGPETTVWKRSDRPGPGIFDTPLGRIGGVICFDSFARETFVNLHENDVNIVIIVACWGNFVRSLRPVLVFGRNFMMRPWSRIAAEVVPYQYATQLGVPTVFVNQSGKTRITTTLPEPLDLPLPDAGYAFYGRSRILDAAGQVVVQAPETSVEYCAVAEVAVDSQSKRDSPVYETYDNRYLKRETYFVEPPPVAKVFQAWSSYGYQSEYERRRMKHSSCDG